MICPRDGRLRATYNSFGLRDLFKRLYIALKRYGAETGKPTMIMSHVSNTLPVAFLGFMDNRLDGKQYLAPVRKERKSYHDLIPLAKWRAMNLSANIGSRAMFLPEYHKDYTKDSTRTRQLLGILMLHDMVGVWFAANHTFHTATVHSMWRLQDAFGIEDAQLLPYWNNASVIGGQTATEKATAYRKGAGGALIVICNLANQRTTTDLSISWARLQSPGVLAVVDAETDKAIAVAGSALTLEIAPREHRVLWCK